MSFSPSLIRYLLLAALLGTTAWLSRAIDWESLVGFLTTLGTYLAYEISLDRKVSQRTKHIEYDREIFKELQEAIQFDSDIVFLRDHDHGDAFKVACTERLFDFAQYWKSPQREFLDQELEALRNDLLRAVNRYVQANAQYTFPSSRSQTTQRLSDYLYETNPDEWKRQRRELNSFADEVVLAYEQLIRTASRKL